MMKAVGARVIINPDKAKETTESGIILTEVLPDIPDRGVVVSVGEKVEELNEGDYVIFDPMGITPVTYEEEEYFLFYETQIIAKIEK
jgi:co-chaperonin GroES (HSP10)